MSESEATSLRDTAPGAVPEMDFSRTLPTGAAFHATWRIPDLATSNADPGQESGVHAVERSSASTSEPGSTAPATMPDDSRASDAAKRATTPMKFSVPPMNHPVDEGSGDSRAHFGTTRREFNQPKLSPREKAKRNILTHTLQMPLVVTKMPVQPAAAGAVERAVQLAATQRQGSQPSPLPGGWTSVHRVGSGAPADASVSRPPAHRSTEPMRLGDHRRDEYGRRSLEEATLETPRVQTRISEPPRYSRPPAVQASSMQDSARWTQLRTGDYERVTVPGDAVRIPELSGREWMFIALLACASAATLYSLLVDDMTTSGAEEESVEAATTIEHEHLVQPALPNLPNTSAAAGQPLVAVATHTTEIVSEPSSAEIVVGGAVIGNTPAKVVRGPTDADYLLRKQGYEPQLVRVTPNSPKSITITLHPK